MESGLQLSSDLIGEGRIADANRLLKELEKKYPSHQLVLNNLAHTCYELGDLPGYLECCRKLFDLTQSAEHLLVLASAYHLNQRPVLAIRAYRRFIERWPEADAAQDVLDQIAIVEPDLHLMIAESGLIGDEGLESAAMHEEVQVLLGEGNFTGAANLCRELIERHPDFAPAYNNLSLTQFFNGDTGEAITIANRVLDFAPDNFQALANLARFLVLNGERDKALAAADRLNRLAPANQDHWIKKAETFTCLCDDRTVLQTFSEAASAGIVEESHGDPFFYHLAATAALHLGDEENARKYWKQALAAAPGFELAKENLDDLHKPVGERHGPWAYDLRYWLPQQTFKELRLAAHRADRKESDSARWVTRFLEEHPEVNKLIPLLLDRGDPHAADFAISLIGAVRTPQLLEMVKSFALGKRGSDQMRTRAALLAVDTGLLHPGEIRMWINGEWSIMLLTCFEITDQPYASKMPSKAKDLVRAALGKLQDNNGIEAEQLLKQASKKAPNEVSIQYNLALAYLLQGRKDEYRQLIEEIHQRDSDYLFGRVQMSRFYLERGEIEKAKEMLDPLLRRKTLHVDELSALCEGQIDVLLKEGRRDSARSWLTMLEQAYPDHPKLVPLRLRVEGIDPVEKLRRLFSPK